MYRDRGLRADEQWPVAYVGVRADLDLHISNDGWRMEDGNGRASYPSVSPEDDRVRHDDRANP